MTGDDLGALLELLQQDKTLVLRSQLTSISVEIGDRKQISNDIARSINDEVLNLSNTILNLTRHDHADAYLKERVTLQEQRSALAKELRAEERESWKDCQELRKEQRLLELDIVQTGQRKQRLEGVTNASRPV